MRLCRHRAMGGGESGNQGHPLDPHLRNSSAGSTLGLQLRDRNLIPTLVTSFVFFVTYVYVIQASISLHPVVFNPEKTPIKHPTQRYQRPPPLQNKNQKGKNRMVQTTEKVNSKRIFRCLPTVLVSGSQVFSTTVNLIKC